jgi:hypothetical protein
MKLQTVGPADRGSLSIVYSCPECGYEMAMLTNAYETQMVQSLGVRIAPGAGADASTNSSRAGCPFSSMIPAMEDESLTTGARSAPAGAERGGGPPASDGVGGAGGAKPPGLEWTAAAEARLANIPAFVRPMARTGIEQFARERGVIEVDEKILDAAREFFGM